MKKILKRVGIGIGAFLLLAVLGITVRFYVLLPKSRPPPDVKALNTPEAIARGKYLAHHVAVCLGCHSTVQPSLPGDPPVAGKEFAGRDFGQWPGAPFRLRSPNLTPDPETGIGNVPDGVILRAMREGIGRDGRVLFPQMPYQTYHTQLSDEDALSVIGYLRTVPAVKQNLGKTTIDFPVSMFIRTLPTPMTASPPPQPPASDKLARGKWLLTTCSCRDCHDSFKEPEHMPIPGKEFAGGFRLNTDEAGHYAVAPNITSDKATGIGAYTDDDLKKILNEGKGKDGRDLYMMPWYYFKGMTDEDKDALIFALRAVPPVVNVVPPSKTK